LHTDISNGSASAHSAIQPTDCAALINSLLNHRLFDYNIQGGPENCTKFMAP